MGRKFFVTAVVFGTLGFIAGNAFWYLASPLWIDRVVSETLVETTETVTLATGEFSGADRVHLGAGTVNVINTGAETVLRFTGFKVTNGPDLYVWLVKANGIASSSDVKAAETMSLGVLKGNIGDQNYTLPEGVDISQYGTVVIWCKQFGVLFASAELV